MNDLGFALRLEAPGSGLAGFRLDRFEVFNWGTFHNCVWGINLRGANALLTGDIGSGKSTLVDAITTLLVQPQKITYNRAAGADTRERTLRSYVLGHFRTERSGAGLTAKPVGLRDANTYSVILGRFVNELQNRQVTLAQVFWLKDTQSQPARLYVVADRTLSIAEHFAGFGTDIAQLRKRLRGMAAVEMHDSFPPYGAAYRRRFGIDNEQAMDLFYQTMSMKSVGNLTEFVRAHMLEAFPVEARINALIGHFDDLNRAHEAVLKAKRQIELLTPVVADCDEHTRLCAEIDTLRRCRDALRPWFAAGKAELLQRRLGGLEEELTRLTARLASFAEQRARQSAERDTILQAIQENGGDRISRIQQEVKAKEVEKDRRLRRADQYNGLAKQIDLPEASDIDGFLANKRAVETELKVADDALALAQNAITEHNVEFRQHSRSTTSSLPSCSRCDSGVPTFRGASWICETRFAAQAGLRLRSYRSPGSSFKCGLKGATGKGPSNVCCTISACLCWSMTRCTRASPHGSIARILATVLYTTVCGRRAGPRSIRDCLQSRWSARLR